jgi:iron uptake system component EfeO
MNRFPLLNPKRNFQCLLLPTTILAIAIGAVSCTSSQSNDPQDANIKKVAVTATNKGCEPNQVETTADKTIFVVTNKGTSPLEFEILLGVKVIEERENIAPNFVQELKANLEVGEYDLICGKIGLPKGKLIVKAAPKEEATTQAKSSVDQNKLVGAIAEYKVYVLQEVAANKITGEENRYVHTDLADFQANIDGSQKIVELLRPLVQKANPELLTKVDANFTKVNQSLSKYKTPDGDFASYEKLTETDKKELKAVLASLSEDLSKLRGILGVD